MVMGCGGGSSANNVIPASGTVVKTWNATNGVNYPKHMVFLDGNLLIANHGPEPGPGIGGDAILKIDRSGVVTTFSSVGEPIGLARNGNAIYVTSRDSGNNLGIVSLVPSPPTARASLGANYYGLTFLGATKAYAIDGGDVNAFDFDPMSNSFTPTTTIPVSGSFHQGIVADGNFLYISNTDGTIKKINTTDNSVADITFNPLNPFQNPNAMVTDGSGYMYVISAGHPPGDNGYISKIHLSTLTVTTFVTAAQVGLCGGAGLAIDDGYIYASNGTCTDPSLHHRILKIKL